jgi:hypothetical protein
MKKGGGIFYDNVVINILSIALLIIIIIALLYTIYAVYSGVNFVFSSSTSYLFIIVLAISVTFTLFYNARKELGIN